jgi:Na+/glutamate symporter
VWTNAGGIALAVVFAAAILGVMRTANWFQPEDFPSAQSWGVAGAAIGVVYGVVSGLVLIKLLRPMPAADSIAGTTSISDT